MYFGIIENIAFLRPDLCKKNSGFTAKQSSKINSYSFEKCFEFFSYIKV